MLQTNAERHSVVTRGKRIYFDSIKDDLADDMLGHLLAIDVNTGTYEVGDTAVSAIRSLRERKADAEIFLMRHGSVAVGSIGFAPTRIRY